MSFIFTPETDATKRRRLRVPFTVLFVGCYLLGVAFFLYGSETLYPLQIGTIVQIDVPFSMIWSAGLVAAYGSIIWGITAKTITNMSREKMADSIYFLGFLFTLTALMVSFLLVGSNLGNTTTNQTIGSDIRHTVALSGMALMTTIVGMIFRVLMLQFIPATEHEFEEMKNHIEGTSTAIKNATDAIKNLRRGLTNEVNYLNDELQKINQRISEQLEDGIKIQTNTITENLENRISNIKKSIDKIHNKGVSKYKESLLAFTTQAGRSFESIMEEIENIKSSLTSVDVASNHPSMAHIRRLEEVLKQFSDELKPVLEKLANDRSAEVAHLQAKTAYVNADHLKSAEPQDPPYGPDEPVGD